MSDAPEHKDPRQVFDAMYSDRLTKMEERVRRPLTDAEKAAALEQCLVGARGWYHPRLSREDCVRHGGHCWEDAQFELTTGYTRTKQQTCKHCDCTRTGVSREPWEWTYPKEQQ